MAEGFMKKFILFTTILIIGILSIIIYINSKTIDTKYATKYAQVFGSYDIGNVDKYLNSETLITYNGITDTYGNLRNNVIKAFEMKEYKMTEGYSYGHGDDIFINGIQNIGIQSYVDSDKYSSNFVSMDIERRWFIFYRVKTMSSNDDFFAYLFFGME